MSSKKKQKQISIEEYIENYCLEKRIRGRCAVYISPQTHLNLKITARLFNSEHYTTTSSLADSIISRHFETHKELLDKTLAEDKQESIRRFEEELREYRRIKYLGYDNLDMEGSDQDDDIEE